MADGKQLARRNAADVAIADSPAGLRQVIMEALRAYELAAATRLKAERQATAAYDKRTRSVAELEQRASQERERDELAEHDTGAAETARIETLARLAAEAETTAVRLLESSSLAHVRGTGEALAGPVHPHTATDEQAAAAFAAAQTAAVDLRTALIRLAAAQLGNGDWEAARTVLVPLYSETAGPLRDEAAALLRASYRDQATAAIAGSDWEQARTVAESALSVFSEGLGADPVLASHFARAVGELASAAAASGRPDEAERHIAVARERLGEDHPALRDWTRRVFGLADLRGPLTCLQEFGGHRQLVLDVAFTADGERLVSVDGDQISIWQLTGSGALASTVPAPGAYQLTGGASLAVTADGALLRTDDGGRACSLAGATEGSVTAFASSADGSVVAWASREQEPSRTLGLREHYGYTPSGRSGRGSPEMSDVTLLGPFGFAQKFAQKPLRNALDVSAPTWGSEYEYRNAYARLVRSIQVADGLTGKLLRNFGVGSEALILSLAISSSADFVAWLHPAGQVVITDIATEVTRYKFRAVAWQTSYDTIAVSPHDRLVAIAQSRLTGSGWEGTVTAWDVATGGTAHTWTIYGIIGGIAFSPDERLIAALTTQGNVALYDTRARSPHAVIIASHGMADYPRIAFSPDGSRLVTSGDRRVKVWGVQ